MIISFSLVLGLLSAEPSPTPGANCNQPVALIDEKTGVAVTPGPSDDLPPGNDGVKVVVRVLVHADGTIDSASLKESSGNLFLDNAALKAAKSSRYEPKTVNCVPVAGEYDFAVWFVPTGR